MGSPRGLMNERATARTMGLGRKLLAFTEKLGVELLPGLADEPPIERAYEVGKLAAEAALGGSENPISTAAGFAYALGALIAFTPIELQDELRRGLLDRIDGGFIDCMRSITPGAGEA